MFVPQLRPHEGRGGRIHARGALSNVLIPVEGVGSSTCEHVLEGVQGPFRARAEVTRQHL